MTEDPTTSVLFVCVKNAGKSQMAAALLRHHAEETGRDVQVHSAGTQPGSTVNQLCVEVIAETGADMSAKLPQPIDAALLGRVDRVIIVGGEAHIKPVTEMKATIETWQTVEPSHRGIDGLERMRLIRDDIDHRVKNLLREISILSR